MTPPLTPPANHYTVSQSDVDQYRRLGHTGFILAYREQHAGEDPEVAKLRGIADSAEKRRSGVLIRAFKAIVDIFT